MREIDLVSTYIQAIGHGRDGVMDCSSLGEHPIALGGQVFHTRAGVTIYLDVPVGTSTHTPLMAVQQDGYVVLTNRELSLDSAGADADTSLTVAHLDRPVGATPPTARGYIADAWLGRIGSAREATFVDGRHLVAIVRSAQFPTAAIAAIRLSRVQARAASIAWRLVPAGAAAGLLAAAAILLQARRRTTVAAALRHALRKDAFFLAYQPIVDTRTGQCIGAEALLRLRRDGIEPIGPELFIPIAEETGLATRLTERVFELVEREAGAFLARHPRFHVALNVCAVDLRPDVLLPLIDRFLAKSGARPSNLVIEITERVFVGPASARAAIDGLRRRGVAVAIDDFGTGYSSLSHLESLELDLLKIDRSFIESIGTGAPTSQVVEHIIAMARTIGLAMIAEGIETEQQAAFVRERGVDYAQGWLFGRPMPFEELAGRVAGG